MAKRGRKTKPTALKVFEGNRGKRALPKNEPDPPTGEVIQPFSLDEIGERVWEIVLATSPKDMIRPSDALALWQYCKAWSDAFEAEKELQEHGSRYCVSEKGGVYLHPAVGVLSEASKRIRQLGPLFGWSPSDRASLDFGDGKESPADELARLLMGKKSGSA